ncbi:MAG: gluconate 2-dehydrogenase subunit 3 family protein [Alphaproteobacteria bacterium]|nr:gluconate 2-dehydrogenase subunit 3 family protein [Alphaproteobacteria bacterium]
MAERYPGYDVLRKRGTLSWNDRTRSVVDGRLGLPDSPRFLSVAEWRTLAAAAARIVPQPEGRPPVNVAAIVDDRLLRDRSDGFRQAGVPRFRDAWRIGLAAMEAEARERFGTSFAGLDAERQESLLRALERGDAGGPHWQGMDPKQFWSSRLLADVVAAYSSHPSAWSAIGFGGPASPRGYVRLQPGLDDPWEASEDREKNLHVR